MPASSEMTLVNAVNFLFPSILVESSLFGVLTVSVIFAIFTIARQGISSRSRVIMVVAVTVMYIGSGIHWAMNIYTVMREIRDPQAWAALPIQDVYRWSVVTTIALFFNFWLSDMIVMWRACVVWAWDRRVTIPCGIFVVVPLTLAIVDVATSHASLGHNSFQPNVFGLVALLVSLLSNVWATTLVGFKAWRYRRDIQAHLGNAGTTSAVQSILVLLVESGFLYCALWTLFIVSTAMNKGSFTYTAHTISGAVPQLVGLYPTVVIVLVSLRKTHCDRNFTYDTPVGSTELRREDRTDIVHPAVGGAENRTRYRAPFTVSLSQMNTRNEAEPDNDDNITDRKSPTVQRMLSEDNMTGRLVEPKLPMFSENTIHIV